MLLPSWVNNYKKTELSGDITAGIIVAVVLVPQSMAYGLLAGLPPEVALYSSVLPLILYAAFGSSRTLAVGPVGLMSLMTGAALIELGISDVNEMVSAAHTLALLTGIIMLLMRIAKLGGIINFLSHPVISGFVSASAIIIALSQVKHILGLDIPRGLPAYETAYLTITQATQSNSITAAIGIGSLALLWWFKTPLVTLLTKSGANESVIQFASKSGPLATVAIGTFIVYYLNLQTQHHVDIIGHIPPGLPAIILPNFELSLIKQLFPYAILIALIGYLESVSIGKSMASQKRQKIDSNKELVGLGSANIASAICGGYPVAGGFGRSMVNFSAGANSPLASIITACLVALTLVALTPLFFFLPKAALGAIIVLAVLPLIDTHTLLHAWNYDRADAFSMLITFFTVLIIDVESGIVAGVIMSIALYLHRTSQPHIAIVGQVGNTEHYRNIDRHQVKTDEHILALRVDENLYFANTNFLEDTVMRLVADNPSINHVLLICSSISHIDTSALESLDDIHYRLEKAGIKLHLAEIKGPVMDKLQSSSFISKLGADRIYLSTHQAMLALKEQK
ncbi:MAG: sodium-independent anion transporter [Piscirickettsiaceae bacterium]|nr:MAG: sodium-independent anion transporter [Piscirickettsiaceae bacterium]PCI71153.1 MAG: sodium-independent anion transporter [Piscirickettsiaceae bacterium]